MEDIYILEQKDFPPYLLEIPEPPDKLFVRGKLPSPEKYIYLAVVGSRKYTSYGKDIVKKLISGLKDYPIVIVSGLALGIDSIAHQTAIENNILTIAIPGSGLDRNVIYPKSNYNLAEEILEKGGCLISELKPDEKANTWTFPRRNRIMAGLCKAVLVIEAEEKSGTLITSRLATEYNRDVLSVPGSIFSDNSKGTNMLIRLGATPITSVNDLLESLSFEIEESKENIKIENLNKDELEIIDLLNEPKTKEWLIKELGVGVSEASIRLTMMELKGLIKEEFGEIRKI